MTTPTGGQTWGPRWVPVERPGHLKGIVRVDGTAAERRYATAGDGGAKDDDEAPPLTPAQRAALEREKQRARARLLARLRPGEDGFPAARGQTAPGQPDGLTVPTGDEIRERREQRGWSQRDLAVAADLSRGLISEIEAGRRTHWLSRQKCAEALGMLAGGAS